MTSARQAQVKRICQEALDHDPASRAAFVGAACAEDEDLLAEVRSLLAHEQAAQHFLETPARMTQHDGARPAAGMPPRIGTYDVVSELGSGGMGRVYRAHDSRLGRDVAIKVLPAGFLLDGQARARLEHEARMLGALNHPHVAAIYGIEDTNDGPALVLELVDGETLAERLARSAGARKAGLPFDEALGLARQIADALEAAHEKGIVHRDLKPANVMVSPEGTVKVLDFGIAKALTVGESVSVTGRTLALTGSGFLIGTPAYMSPEQAQGRRVDERTDIWAFGCVLYEMLTGRRAFGGDTPSGTVAAVLALEPDWGALPVETPSSIRQLLRRCLAKDRKRRLAHIADVRLELEEAASTAPENPAASSDEPRGLRRREVVAWSAAGACLLMLITSVWLSQSRNGSSLPVRFAMGVPQSRNQANTTIALAPDGTRLAFVAPNSAGEDVLWVRRMDQFEGSPLPGTAGAYAPVWAPDSASLAFFAGGQLKRTSADGGPVRVLCEVLAPAWPGPVATWNRRGDIVYAQAFGPLHRVSAEGGVPEPVTTIDSARREFGHYTPTFLPDGDRFVYLGGAAEDTSAVYVGSLHSKERTRFESVTAPSAVTPNGVAVFLQNGLVTTQQLDVKRMQLVGTSVPAADDAEAVSVSDNGTLAYRETTVARRQLTWYDRGGRALGTVGAAGPYEAPVLSPDGTKVAVGRAGDVWVFDLTRKSSETRLTTGPARESYPVWSPDGYHVLYMRGEGAGPLLRQPATGAGREEMLMPEGGVPFGWSADGLFVTYLSSSPATLGDAYVLPLSGERKPMLFRQTRFQEGDHILSPNGRWMAYASAESGTLEIFVQPFPASEKRWAISTDGGTQPAWRRDGKELFYLALDGRLMVVDIEDAQEFEPGLPRPLFQTNAPVGFVRNSYTATPDGQRFLVNVMPPNAESRVIVVLNSPALTAD